MVFASWRAYPLTFFLFLFTVTFHAWNWRSSDFFDVTNSWSVTRLKFRLFGKDLIAGSFPSRPTDQRGDEDAASKTIQSFGQVLQFRAGRLPDFILLGRSIPYQKLYPREEIPFQYSPATFTIRNGFSKLAPPFIEALEKGGVTVVILPVPTKISFERESLPKVLPSANPWFQERNSVLSEQSREVDNYSEFVRAAPDNVVDLYSALKDGEKRFPGEVLYVPSATHWSSLGTAIAVEAVLAHLRKRGWPLEIPKLVYENRLMPNYQHDLLRALLLPESFLSTDVGFQWFEPIYDVLPVVRQVSAKRIYVAGSCYSRRHHEEWGLGALLGRSLQRLHIDSSLDFATASQPIEAMVSQGYALERGDLLVWEFPERNPPLPGTRIPVPEVIQ